MSDPSLSPIAGGGVPALAKERNKALRATLAPASRTRFSPSQLNQLMASFCHIQTASPDCLPKFHAIFDACDDAALTQLANAGIKFVSKLAVNACVRRGIA